MDLAELRERMQEFYAYAFLPPSVTDDDFGEESETETEAVEGPQKPPTEPRIVADGAEEATDDPLAIAQEYARRSRQRADEFYAYAFLPPSVTNDDFGTEPDGTVETDPGDFDGFVFSNWLEAGRPTGPQNPPEQPRVVSDAAATTEADIDTDQRFEFVEWLESEAVDVETTAEPAPEPAATDREYGEFDFVEWLDSGEEGFEPIGIAEEPDSEAIDEPAVDEPASPTVPAMGLKPHPAKAATYALFLAVLTLAVLSIIGYAPVLGPATGLGG